MASRKFINGLKLKELPHHMEPYFSINFIKNSIEKGLHNYHINFIQSNSAEPLYHLCFGGLIFSYLIALPEERRHLAHQRAH
ncbi:unnamed protein product [Lupinus luteus]|uniref:Uncharacterized protein n=1 Tax=Lupinus luteus TaxID=3873 RepID=A0AAV1XEZ5_LUPLU